MKSSYSKKNYLKTDTLAKRSQRIRLVKPYKIEHLKITEDSFKNLE